MRSLSEVAQHHTALTEADLAWLQLLVADWQIIADLSFADLVLWVPDRDGTGHRAVAQVRPTTGPTAYVDDVVGAVVPRGERPLLDQAVDEGRLGQYDDPQWREQMPVRVEMVPVRREGRVIAAVARDTNLRGVRTPSRLEQSYLQTAGDLVRMIAGGHFPVPGERTDHADSPRVGDGFVRIDRDGSVVYASPNALSVFRRLGLSEDLAGLRLADVTRRLVPPHHRPDEETLSVVLGGRTHRDTEIATVEVALTVRAVPLLPEGERTGALVLVRDVTELRRRDRELVSKDATIREIHHRVKNNLQTVAALLRMQGRRAGEGHAASALGEAERRVGSIAVVHEILSQSVAEQVDFDEIADRLAAMVVELSPTPGAVDVSRTGSFGELSSRVATPLAMVLTELVQNALEHGYGDTPGTAAAVRVEADRGEATLRVRVHDDGRGLPPDFELGGSTHLGLSIVRALVTSELEGSLTLGAPEGEPVRPGTMAVVEIPLR